MLSDGQRTVGRSDQQPLPELAVPAAPPAEEEDPVAVLWDPVMGRIDDNLRQPVVRREQASGDLVAGAVRCGAHVLQEEEFRFKPQDCLGERYDEPGTRIVLPPSVGVRVRLTRGPAADQIDLRESPR